MNPNICRTCLQTASEQFNLFNYIEDDKTLSEMLLECTNLKVEESDMLPCSICVICKGKLTSSWSFRKLALNSDSKLRNEYSSTLPAKAIVVKNESMTIMDENSQSVGSEMEGLQPDYPGNLSQESDATKEQDQENSKKQYPGLVLVISNALINHALLKAGFQANSNEYPDKHIHEDKSKEIQQLKYTNNCSENNEQVEISQPELNIICKTDDTFIKSEYVDNAYHCDDDSVVVPDTMQAELKNVYSIESEVMASSSQQSDNSTVEDDGNKNITISSNDSSGYPRPKIHCKDCDKMVSHNYYYRIHIYSHKGGKLFQCNACDKSFINVYRLIKHKASEHKRKPLTCYICGEIFESFTALRSHRTLHRGDLAIHGNQKYECKVCKKVFKTAKTLYYHHRAVHIDKDKNIESFNVVTETYNSAQSDMDAVAIQNRLVLNSNNAFERSILCAQENKEVNINSAIIEKEYQPNSDDKQHFEASETPHYKMNAPEEVAQHSDNSTIEADDNKNNSISINDQSSKSRPKVFCKECNKMVSHDYYYRVHIHSHIGGKLWQCNACDKSYINEYRLIKHKASEHKNEPHTCYICGKSFESYTTLRSHRTMHRGDLVKHRNQKHECKVCKRIFKTVKTLYYHHKSVHTDKGKKSHVCTVCNQAFKEEKNLEKHILRHKDGKKYICELCGKPCTTFTDLNFHRSTHNTERVLPCATCGKLFANERRLKAHIMWHKKDKPFICNYCDKSFKTGNAKDRHVLIHTGERPHSCWICDKKFIDTGTLSRHMLTHTGETPFSCDKCTYKCKYKQQLDNHKKKHKDK